MSIFRQVLEPKGTNDFEKAMVKEGMDVGQKIRELRKEKNLSQADLAKRIGVHQRYVSTLETGKRMPAAETLIKLSTVFRVSIDYLLLDNVPKEGTHKIDDFELYQEFRETESLPEDDKKLVRRLVSLLTFQQKVRKAEEETRKREQTEAPAKTQEEAPPLRKVAGKR